MAPTYIIYINGKKPSTLVGAQDNKIDVIAQLPVPAVTRAPADSDAPNEKNASYRAEKQASESFYPAFFDMAENFYRHCHYAEALKCYDQPLLMSVLDFLPHDELWNCSYVDQAIDFVGYTMSRVFPDTPQDKEYPPGASPAIPPMMHITVQTPKGSLGIKSGHGLLRTYDWDGVTRSLELYPPDNGDHSFHSRRYSAQRARIPAYDWVNHKGITRGEAWESRTNFRSMHEANSWLEGQRDEALPCVWTHDGLVVGWSTNCDWKSLTILVHQVLINGKKPTSLDGSDDSKFAFSSARPL